MKYKTVKNRRQKLTEKDSKLVRRFVPKYSSNIKSKNYWLYCKFNLIRCKPFRDIIELYTDETKPEEFILMWSNFLQSEKGKKQINNWTVQLDQAKLTLKALDDGVDVECDPYEMDEDHSWLIKQVKPFIIDQDIIEVERNPAVWSELNHHYDSEDLANLDNILRTHSSTFYGKLDLSGTNAGRQQIDLSTLTKKQMKAYRIVRDHSNNTRKNKKSLRTLIRGTTGTGKSYLLDVLTNLLDGKVVLTATTGMASFNIGGVTLISALKLHVKKLPKSRLMELQNNFQSAEYLIIDEMSMISTKLLGQLDERLREVKAVNKPYNGMSVLFFGDFAQLPPVTGDPMWKKPIDGEDKINGYALFKQMNVYVELDQPKRQKDKKIYRFMK